MSLYLHRSLVHNLSRNVCLGQDEINFLVDFLCFFLIQMGYHSLLEATALIILLLLLLLLLLWLVLIGYQDIALTLQTHA